MQETQVQSLGREDPLEKEMATHSSIFARKIPRTEEPGRLCSPGVSKELDTTLWLKQQNALKFLPISNTSVTPLVSIFLLT